MIHIEAEGPVLDSATTTNPGNAAVLATTGALRAGFYEVRIVVGSTVDGRVEVARRNSGDSADVGDVVTLRVKSAQPSAEYILRYTLAANERITVRTPAALVGDVDAAIFAEALI